jgi:hypothetical protein
MAVVAKIRLLLRDMDIQREFSVFKFALSTAFSNELFHPGVRVKVVVSEVRRRWKQG